MLLASHCVLQFKAFKFGSLSLFLICLVFFSRYFTFFIPFVCLFSLEHPMVTFNKQVEISSKNCESTPKNFFLSLLV